MRTINELTQEEKDRVDLMLTSTDYETRGANAMLSYLPSHVNRESLDAYIEQVVDSAIRGKRKPIECCGKSIGQLLTKIDPDAPKRSFHLSEEGKQALEKKRALENFKVVDPPKKKRGRPPKAKQAAKTKKKDPVKVELPPIINAEPEKASPQKQKPIPLHPTGKRIDGKNVDLKNIDIPDMECPIHGSYKAFRWINPDTAEVYEGKCPKCQMESAEQLPPVVEVKKNKHIALQLTIQDGVVAKVDEIEEPKSINPPYYQNMFQNIIDLISRDRIIAEYLAVDEEAGIMQFRFKRST
jgi:hypothetical protein